MRYYIDGNNLAGFLFKRLKAGDDARAKAANLLAGRRLPKLTTLVFDGFPFRSGAPTGPFRVLFSEGRTADQVIAGAVKRGDVVVSADRELLRRAAFKGAKGMGLDDFMKMTERQVTDGEKPVPGTDVDSWMEIFSGNGGDDGK